MSVIIIFFLSIGWIFYQLSKSLRQRLNEKHEQESIFDSLIEGVVVQDEEGIIRYANPAFAKIVGLRRRQLLGQRMTSLEVAHKALLDRCWGLIKLAQAQGTIVTDSIALEEKLFLDLIVVPKSLKRGAAVVIQDKSSERQVVQMGKEFISNAAHELRTPITIIQGFAEMLRDLKMISPSMLAEITEKIIRNCERMNTLVKNLLTLADLENIPKSRFQPCDLISLADNCKHILEARSLETTILLKKTQESLTVDADPDLLELAFMNLLENGVKYSKTPSHLTIHIFEKESAIFVEFQDQGMGIPADDLPHIFERFYTVNKAHSRRLGGAGLGLSIVKTIMDKHEGAVSVASEYGKGTTFTLTFQKKNCIF